MSKFDDADWTLGDSAALSGAAIIEKSKEYLTMLETIGDPDLAEELDELRALIAQTHDDIAAGYSPMLAGILAGASAVHPNFDSEVSGRLMLLIAVACEEQHHAS